MWATRERRVQLLTVFSSTLYRPLSHITANLEPRTAGDTTLNSGSLSATTSASNARFEVEHHAKSRPRRILSVIVVRHFLIPAHHNS
jgi:hypothetical protein